MSLPTESAGGRYAGKHVKKSASSRRGLLALLILLLVTARLGATGLKALSVWDRYTSGSRLLIYGDVQGIDFGDSLKQGELQGLIEPQDDGKTLIYRGHTYRLNEKLVTVLFMGIDRTLTEEERVAGAGGQSDVLLLIGLDTETGRSTILNISRDTYAEVDEYSASGNRIGTVYEQITLAFAYGDGREKSCENTITSVQRLLYGLPISSYIALDMEGVQAANESVGGVKLKSLLTCKMPDGTEVKEGDMITLHGKNLDRYIRIRTDDVDANAARMVRQKQFITEFSKAVVRKSSDRLTYPVDLFSALSPYMITDLELADVTFLSSCFLENGAHFNFRSVDGTYDILESNGSAVYYLDEVDLFEAVLQVFYQQVD